jgi:hypothetical protein
MAEDEWELHEHNGLPNLAQPTEAERDKGKEQLEAYAQAFDKDPAKGVILRDGIIIYDGR